MALIIKLHNEVFVTQEIPDADEVRDQHSAEVVIFPGVRYERWEDAQSDANDPQQSQGSSRAMNGDRDWLKI